jgi:hypothetical protein
MKHQVPLDFNGERLAVLVVWQQLPPVSRKEAVALWAHLIALAAQRRSNNKGGRHEPAQR